MEQNPVRQKVLGVLGGMGPLASAEFVKTIYEFGTGLREQQAPFVLLYSDPSFPDRTETILERSCEPMQSRLLAALSRLRQHGASKIVICCVTSHHFLPGLPDQVRSEIISLVEVTLNEVSRQRKRHLLLCSTGTRRAEVFESHPMWPVCKDYFVIPDDADQRVIHDDVIYQIKKNQDVRKLVPSIERLLSKYGVDSFIAGCTEIHLLVKHILAVRGQDLRQGFIDPLITIAKKVATGEI